MIVADTSALVAVVLGEPDAERYRDALIDNPVAVCAVSMTEARIVLHARQGLDAVQDLDELLTECAAQIIGYDASHALVAHTAWERFGKGRHPAGLNFGDCMAYATAHRAKAPLLFKGNDFTRTDIASVL